MPRHLVPKVHAEYSKLTEMNGNRLTHMKITGSLVKDSFSNGVWEEKVHQIRSIPQQICLNEARSRQCLYVTG